MSNDNAITVIVSDDKLYAYLLVEDLDNISQYDIDGLEKLLAAHNVVYGVNKEMLAAIAKTPHKYLGEQVEVAEGIAPVPGENGTINYLYDTNSNTNSPTEDSHGKVDFRQVSTLNNVRKGQILAERVLATKGVPGTSVEGKPIAAKDGKDVRFKLGKSVISNAEHIAVYATIDGLVSLTEGTKLNVFAVYEIKGDVDYSTGNIDFVGSLVIGGSVLDGFKVRSTGDIRIMGSVEGAEIDAGGTVEITAGIVGHNKGYVRAGHSVKSAFIQDANVFANEDIIVSQSIMHSNIMAGKGVYCKTTKGLIIGGHVQAGQKVVAKSIGNTMATATAIEVGVLPDIRNQYTDLKTKLKENIDNRDKTNKSLTLLNEMASSGNIPPEKLAMKIKLTSSVKQLMEEQKQLKSQIAELDNTIEEGNNAVVSVLETIHEGTRISIGRYTKFIKNKATNVTFKVVDSDIGTVIGK